MTPDNELLRQYAKARSEEAFAELVGRHVNLVYSAALRQVGGDAHLAHDVAQNVFTDLARKAGSLSRRESLSGWLYTSAYFAGSKIVRTEIRRREREEQFMREPAHDTTMEADWEKLRPALDAVMHELKETDREAILLRYFENRAFAEVGAKLNLNENTARMRVERALEKLRGLLAKRGITTGAALASVISANAIQTAPGHLAASLASASLAGVGTGALTFLKIMTTQKLQAGLGALAACAITALVVHHQTQQNFRDEDKLLTAQIVELKAANADLSNQLSSAENSDANNHMAELLKLRAEMTRLQTMSNLSPVSAASVTNDLPATNKFVIILKAKFISVPAGNALLASSGWAPAGNGASLISENQLQSINNSLKESNEIHLLSAPQVTTSSGVEATLSETTPVPMHGTNAQIGVIFDVTPFYSVDSSVFTLNLAAQLKQLSSDPSVPGVLTTTVSNQVTLFPNQSVVLQEELPSGALLTDSRDSSDGPRNLLVIVTPTLATAGQSTPPQSAADDAVRNAAIQKMTDAKQGVLALLMFASDNQGQYPTNLAQTSSYLKDGSDESVETNFDLVYSGGTTGIANPAATIVLEEKQAWQTPQGKWMKSYGFADGHAEIHTEPNGDFASYEKDHTIPQLSNQ